MKLCKCIIYKKDGSVMLYSVKRIYCPLSFFARIKRIFAIEAADVLNLVKLFVTVSEVCYAILI